MTKLDFEMEVELARMLGIKPAYCSDIIRGNRNGGETKKKMLKFLGIKES